MKSLILILTFSVSSFLCFCQRQSTKPEIGICQDMERDSLLYASGYRYLVESIAKCVSPTKISDEAFEKNLRSFKKLRVGLYAVNIFMPGEMKLVGPQVNEQLILEYSRSVFVRCQQAGINMIVWGSGGARRVPGGFDHKKATDQFISIARKVAEIAKEYNIRLALENLNHTETNFINTVKDALEIVRAVDHPNFWLCADIYHMLMEGEGPAIIEKTKKYLIHCDIAEKGNRAPPGVAGDDFTGYLKALRKIRYSGIIVLECRWQDLDTQIPSARVNLQRQIDAVYSD